MRLLALSAVLLVSGFAHAGEASLRFSIADAWAMPLVQIDDHQPTGGFLFDIMQSMAAQANLTAEYRVVPMQRVQRTLERGAIDVRCYAAQSWMPNLSGDYTWSLPLLIQRDLLISTPDNAAPRAPLTLTGETIGTVLGYAYPTLQAAFDNDVLRRDDARSEVQVLQKLQIHRYRYAVGNQWSLDWFNRNLPEEQKLRGVAVLDEQPVGCVVRNDTSIPAQRLMRILLRMRMSGEIDRIMSRYNTVSGLPADRPAAP
ncbi:substrate-binding periplasmic protein [Pseudomonas bohemica]|uniref:substrate-binding periplasmic protein n=1 Tax=Pseudomonas bohemica TaxID=2044872 RepID=UPI000DA5F4BD|nr:transporter substrate-binding domain-containing protein [Pseudomonas bohemica]